MFHRASLLNYQSIRRLDIELGNFTVIVGASSSGKSAFIRAMRTLSSNSRGSSFVTYGEKTSCISVSGDDWTVSLVKGEGQGEYRLHTPSSDLVFTKLAGTVPEQVTEVLRIAPEGAMNYAGQFDRPYLLSESGQQVAAIMGETTNISVVLEAAREANRRRARESSVLKIRQQDLERLEEKRQEFSNLEDELSAIEAAEEQLVKYRQINVRIARLNELITLLMEKKSSLDSAIIQEIPDNAELNQKFTEFTALNRLINELIRKHATINETKSFIESAESKISELERARLQKLVEAGACPMCGQEICDE